MPPLIRHPVFARCILAVLGIALGFVARNGMTGQTSDALVWCGIALVAAIIFYVRDTLPPLNGLLLALAAAVNGAGYTMTLWHDQTLFDEVVHGFTTFAGMAAIGWALVHKRGELRDARAALVGTMLGLALLLGLLWELFEYLVGIIGTPRDTAIDVLMDMIGASVAITQTSWLLSRLRTV